MQRSNFRKTVALLRLVWFLLALVAVSVANEREKKLYVFGGQYAEYPASAPIFDSSGNLYGIAQSTKLDCLCVVYKLTQGVDGGWTFSTVHESDTDLTGNLVFDASGNLYLATVRGGAHNDGSVFMLSPGSNGHWTKTELYSFKGGIDALWPNGNLVIDTSGNVFGLSSAGGGYACGGNGCGTVFRLSPGENGHWTETVIHKFGTGLNGYLPTYVVLPDNGEMYGTTAGGGSGGCYGYGGSGCGTVFTLSLTSRGRWRKKVIYNFSGGPEDGDGPNSLISVSADTLYGTAYFGCTRFNAGCAFKLKRNGRGRWVETIIHRFPSNAGDGGGPVGPLALDAGGNLYGATEGANIEGRPIIFELIPSPGRGWKEHVLHAFTGGGDGGNPQAGVTLDSAGNIYGTASQGGNKTNCDSGCGVVFELTP